MGPFSPRWDLPGLFYQVLVVVVSLKMQRRSGGMSKGSDASQAENHTTRLRHSGHLSQFFRLISERFVLVCCVFCLPRSVWCRSSTHAEELGSVMVHPAVESWGFGLGDREFCLWPSKWPSSPFCWLSRASQRKPAGFLCHRADQRPPVTPRCCDCESVVHAGSVGTSGIHGFVSPLRCWSSAGRLLSREGQPGRVLCFLSLLRAAFH